MQLCSVYERLYLFVAEYDAAAIIFRVLSIAFIFNAHMVQRDDIRLCGIKVHLLCLSVRFYKIIGNFLKIFNGFCLRMK